MQKEVEQYEYKIIDTNHKTEEMNQLGKNGWDAVGTLNSGKMGLVLMKRPTGVITMDLPEYVMKKNNNNSYDR